MPPTKKTVAKTASRVQRSSAATRTRKRAAGGSPPAALTQDEIRMRYQQEEPRYLALRDEVEFALKQSLLDIKTHTVTTRVKPLDDVLEKVGRKQYRDPFEQMDDIVGARVVTLFLSDLPQIERTVESLFRVVERVDHIEGKPADTFGYMSVHYVCTLVPEHRGPRYDRLKGLRFELQLRTIVMDAWANVSHYLAYKGEASIPPEVRRDFFALSGLFYVADQHFEMVATAAARSNESAQQAVADASDTNPIDLNLETGLALLQAQYRDRHHSPRGSVSDFIEEATSHGYKTVQQLERALVMGAQAAEAYESEHPPTVGAPDGRFSDIGIARHALAIYDDNYGRWKYAGERFAKYRRLLPADTE